MSSFDTGTMHMDDIIYVRDIIERIELIEHDEADAVELATLTAIMNDIKGCGGDEQWRGAWYPLLLIRDSYFKDYAQDMAEDCCMVDRNATWPNNCIDWDYAARELQHDYTPTDIGGVTYWAW